MNLYPYLFAYLQVGNIKKERDQSLEFVLDMSEMV